MGKRKPDPQQAEAKTKKGRGKAAAAQDSEESDEPTPTKKPRSKKAGKKVDDDKPKDPYVDELGWNIHPPSLIYRSLGEPDASTKIAAFDLDGTLANVKSRAQFPTDENDWKLCNKKVSKVVQKYAADGYKVVIFSNQNGIKSALEGKMAIKVKKRTQHVLTEIGVPADVFFATGQDEFRKPQTGMWEFFKSNCNDGIEPDLKASFFVGDAAGRIGDIADSDKLFAENIGLPFKTPEDVFGQGDAKKAIATTGTGDAAAVPENQGLCDAFNKLAQKYAGDRFKSGAYAKAAKVLAAYPKVISSGKEVGSLQGVGKASVAKVEEYLTSGTMAALEEDGALGGGAEGPTTGAGAKEAQGSASMALKFL